jgi:hypothetical protein
MGYRDAIGPGRAVVTEALGRLDARRAALAGKERVLPTKLRRELAELARAVRIPVASVNDLRAVEAALPRYEEAIAVAEILVSTAGLGRRRPWLRLAAIALVFGLVPAAVVGVERARPGAVGAASCSFACRDEGRCEPIDGRCQPARDAHCAASRGCRIRGDCHRIAADGHAHRCGPLRHGDCRSSELCAREGHCSLDGRSSWSCQAVFDDDCEATMACLVEGRCRAEKGVCRNVDEDDWVCRLGL